MRRKKGTDKRSKIIRALDRITPEIIKLRDMHQCQRCGARPQPQGCHWSHIYSRASYHTRWDLLNSLVLCNGCHRWWHSHPTESGFWFAKKFPARYDYLQGKRREVAAIKTSELEALLESHKEKLKQLQGERNGNTN